MKVGRRLAMKILNASKFILAIAADTPARTLPTEPVDLAMLATLARVVDQATAAFEAYDYSGALEAAERFFWQFCDDYLELVKERAYAGEDSPASNSARAALREAIGVLLRLFAPFLPFVTEEVWSWWHEGSIHTAAWPKPSDLAAADGDPALLEDVAAALIGIRGAKSQAKVSMKTEATSAVFVGQAEVLNRLLAAEDDLRSVGRISSPIVWEPAEQPLQVTVELKPAEEPAQ
jgi:valyl-tRNA synthetase